MRTVFGGRFGREDGPHGGPYVAQDLAADDGHEASIGLEASGPRRRRCPRPMPATIRAPCLMRTGWPRERSRGGCQASGRRGSSSRQSRQDRSRTRRRNAAEDRLRQRRGSTRRSSASDDGHRADLGRGRVEIRGQTLIPMPIRRRGPVGVSTRSGRIPASFRPSTSTSFGQRMPSGVRGRRQLRATSHDAPRPRPAPASARARAASPKAAGSRARVKVRLPSSDHHEFSPAPAAPRLPVGPDDEGQRRHRPLDHPPRPRRSSSRAVVEAMKTPRHGHRRLGSLILVSRISSSPVLTWWPTAARTSATRPGRSA